MIFGILRKSDMIILQVCPPHLSDVCLPSLLWEIQKSHFRLYYSYILLIIYISQVKSQSGKTGSHGRPY